MRVVLVGNTVTPDALGGLPRYVRELAAALVAAGCDTVILAKRVDGDAPRIEQAPDGVRIVRHVVPSKRNPLFGAAYPFYAARGVLGAIRSLRGPGTIVHAHFPVTALPLALSGERFLYTFHAPVWRELLDERQDTYRLPPAVQRTAVAAVRASERLVVARAAGTFVLSDFMRGQLGELNAAVAGRSRLLAGGVDLARFAPDPAVPRAGPGAPVIFTARRLTPRTGVGALVAAMPELLQAHPEATLVVAGTGELAAELGRLAAQLGVAERVRFLGRVSDAELVAWYRRATLVVVPTQRLEGFGLSTAEALACGTPVIGTPAGATSELLTPLDPALIARDSSAPALAQTVIRMLADPARLESIGARARARVAPAMGWEAIAHSYIAAYRGLPAPGP